MRNISIFVEDIAHEDFLTSILIRFANDHNIKININASSVRGGHGTVSTELKQFLRDLRHNRQLMPDLVIVGTDSNCKGYLERKNEIRNVISNYSGIVICMIPDPHIERWLLLDSEAFKSVYGKGCQKPDKKCEKGRYKNLLLNAIFQATKISPLDGMERIDDLVEIMNFQQLEQLDDSIGKFIKSLRQRFRTWQQSED